MSRTTTSIWSLFQDLSETRCRLYQRQLLRRKRRFSAFFDLYIVLFISMQKFVNFQHVCTDFGKQSAITQTFTGGVPILNVLSSYQSKLKVYRNWNSENLIILVSRSPYNHTLNVFQIVQINYRRRIRCRRWGRRRKILFLFLFFFFFFFFFVSAFFWKNELGAVGTPRYGGPPAWLARNVISRRTSNRKIRLV